MRATRVTIMDLRAFVVTSIGQIWIEWTFTVFFVASATICDLTEAMVLAQIAVQIEH